MLPGSIWCPGYHGIPRVHGRAAPQSLCSPQADAPQGASWTAAGTSERQLLLQPKSSFRLFSRFFGLGKDAGIATANRSLKDVESWKAQWTIQPNISPSPLVPQTLSVHDFWFQQTAGCLTIPAAGFGLYQSSRYHTYLYCHVFCEH